MKKAMSIVLVLLLVFSTIFNLYNALVFGYAITVDGDPSDWLADASTQAPNTGMSYATGEYVWKDAASDDVGDGDYTYPINSFFVSGMVDILEFRMTYDAHRIYFLIKLGNVTNTWSAGEGFCGILVTIHIDEDRVSWSGQEWTAQGMDAKLDPSCWWEYVIVLHGFGSWIMDSSWTTVGWTGNGMEVKGSESNNCIEVAVDYDKIGSFIGQTWRFTVQVGFEEWAKFREVEENAAEWSPGGGVPLGDNDWVECDAFDACFYTSTTSQTQDWSDYEQSTGNPTILCNTGEGFMDISHASIVRTAYVVLGGAIAPLAKGMGTSEKFYWGSGCWAAVLGQKFEIYIDPTLPPFNALGAFTIDDIASISYYTNTPHAITGTTPYNFYLIIYTKPDGINDHGWYGYKLIGEPYFSNNLDAPANQWNKWSTDAGINQLTFFDPDTIGFYGFYGQPTLQDIQAGPINWHDYYSGCPVTNIDYGIETVKYISFQTATAWMNIFQGFIDAITIALKDGTTVWIDLEGFASEVWVNGDWAGLPPGYEVEPGKFIGYNAFAKIQDGINAVTPNGIVHVYPGEYMEQIVVNKNLSLEGMAGAKILAPNTRSTFTIPESSAVFDPIIFAYGSLSGTETISVTIEGFEIDGGNKAVSNYRYVGILCRNIKLGTISNNIIHSMYPPSGKGSGPQTFGILVYGDSEATIEYNEVRDFSRGGIGVLGDAGSNVDPHAVVQENTVYGNGFEPETGWWAENGIQIAYGATAYVMDNDVFDCTVNNPSWSATGILVVDTSDVVVESNYVEGCDIGIGAVDFPGSIYGSPWDYHTLSNVLIKGNTLIGNTWQVDISNDARNVTLICNNILNAVEDGIDVWSYPDAGVAPTDIKINYNNIVGSGTYGLWVGQDITEPVDARYNWWGDPTGPYHPTLNPTGLGDEVSGNANFEPWLLTEKVPPLVHDVAIIDVVPSTVRVIVGSIVQINVTVKNEGNTYETFDVSIYYDSNLLGTQTITDMIPKATETLTFTWDTSGVPPCHEYTLTAIASAVPGETDPTDNSKSVPVRVGELMTLKVEPPTVNGKILGQLISVNITLNDVMPCWHVIAVQFRICYNDTLLEFVNVTEGPFLKHFAQQQPGSYGTLFLYTHDDHPLYGPSILVGVLILPNATGYWNPPFPEGSGPIATVNFIVKYQERGLEKPKLVCELPLVETDVFDDDGISLPYNVEGGIYKGWPTNIADTNFDGKVDLKDYFAIAGAFGEFPGRPRWNPNVDLNNDEKIDLKDVFLCAKNFGWIQDQDP